MSSTWQMLLLLLLLLWVGAPGMIPPVAPWSLLLLPLLAAVLVTLLLVPAPGPSSLLLSLAAVPGVLLLPRAAGRRQPPRLVHLGRQLEQQQVRRGGQRKPLCH
jgi:hypothetical protein